MGDVTPFPLSPGLPLSPPHHPLKLYLMVNVLRLVVTRVRPEGSDVEAQPLSEGIPDEGGCFKQDEVT